LETGKSGIALGTSVVAIVVDAGMNELATIRSDVSLAETTSSSGRSASSGRSSAEIIESGVGIAARISHESASLTLTEPVSISHIVVSSVPTRAFEHSEGELTVGLLVNQTRSHGFESEQSSFEMGTSGGGTSTVFKVSTSHGGAAKELSNSAGKGFNINDLGSLSTDSTGLDVTGQFLAAGAQEVLVESWAETENVGSFVQNHVDVLFV